jgi:hypothetical protein
MESRITETQPDNSISILPSLEEPPFKTAPTEDSLQETPLKEAPPDVKPPQEDSLQESPLKEAPPVKGTVS